MVLTGIERKCKESLGGVYKLWLFPFVKYSRSQIVVNNNVLVYFPETDIFRFDFMGNISPSDNQQENEGGKFYNQTINFDLIWSENIENVQKLLYQDFRLIIQDRNNVFRIFGLYNGLECTRLEYRTGNTKNDLNGFALSFEGQEEKGAFFIDNLEDAGFFDFDFDYRITQDGDFRVTQDNKYRVLQ